MVILALSTLISSRLYSLTDTPASAYISFDNTRSLSQRERKSSLGEI